MRAPDPASAPAAAMTPYDVASYIYQALRAGYPEEKIQEQEAVLQLVRDHAERLMEINTQGGYRKRSHNRR